MFNFIKERNRIKNYKELFSTNQGKHVLIDLMNYCNFRSSTVGNTPEETYHNEGRRDVFLFILYNLSMDENQIMNMAMTVENNPETDLNN